MVTQIVPINAQPLFSIFFGGIKSKVYYIYYLLYVQYILYPLSQENKEIVFLRRIVILTLNFKWKSPNFKMKIFLKILIVIFYNIFLIGSVTRIIPEGGLTKFFLNFLDLSFLYDGFIYRINHVIYFSTGIRFNEI